MHLVIFDRPRHVLEQSVASGISGLRKLVQPAMRSFESLQTLSSLLQLLNIAFARQGRVEDIGLDFERSVDDRVLSV